MLVSGAATVWRIRPRSSREPPLTRARLCLEQQDGSDGPQMPLDDAGVYAIGRSDECDVRVNREGVEDVHVELIVEEYARGAMLCAMASANPARLNDAPMEGEQKVRLRNGDTFEVGGRLFRYETDDTEERIAEEVLVASAKKSAKKGELAPSTVQGVPQLCLEAPHPTPRSPPRSLTQTSPVQLHVLRVLTS